MVKSSCKLYMKKMEVSKFQKHCYCKRFGVISHTKHNWNKHVKDDMISKFPKIRSSMCSMWKNVGEESENGEACFPIIRGKCHSLIIIIII